MKEYIKEGTKRSFLEEEDAEWYGRSLSTLSALVMASMMNQKDTEAAEKLSLSEEHLKILNACFSFGVIIAIQGNDALNIEDGKMENWMDKGIECLGRFLATKELGFQQDPEIDEIALLQNFISLNYGDILLGVPLMVFESVQSFQEEIVKGNSIGFLKPLREGLESFFENHTYIKDVAETFDQFKYTNKKWFQIQTKPKTRGFLDRLFFPDD